MGVSKNNGTPKLSILIGFSTINHPFWVLYPYFWKHSYGFLFERQMFTRGKLDGDFSHVFFMFIPKLGEDEPILTKGG